MHAHSTYVYLNTYTHTHTLHGERRKLPVTSVSGGQDVTKGQSLHCVEEYVMTANITVSKSTIQVSQKVKNRTTIRSRNPSSRYTFRNLVNIFRRCSHS